MSKNDCPCCNPHRHAHHDGSYQICDICGWEDDGQSDVDADEIKGGPNADYSLTEARNNFKLYGTMCRPNDPRFKEFSKE